MDETEQDQQRILVAEDDPMVDGVLVGLPDDRRDAEVTANGEAALAAVVDAGKRPPDLVFLDLVMQAGIATGRRARKSRMQPLGR